MELICVSQRRPIPTVAGHRRVCGLHWLHWLLLSIHLGFSVCPTVQYFVEGPKSQCIQWAQLPGPLSTYYGGSIGGIDDIN